MDDLNLFELLDRYSNPTGYENFLSISLAWCLCLNYDDGFRKQFFQKVLVGVNDKEGWEIEVQKPIKVGSDHKYPDLVFSKDQESAIIVEVKYDAGISYSQGGKELTPVEDRDDEERLWLDQLGFYRRWLDQFKSETHLFLLARHYQDKKEDAIVNSGAEIIYWHDLGKMDRSVMSDISRQFISYLEMEGVIMETLPADFKELNAQYQRVNRINNTMRFILQDTARKLRDNYQIENKNSRTPKPSQGCAEGYTYFLYEFPDKIKLPRRTLQMTAISLYIDERWGMVPAISIKMDNPSQWKKILRNNKKCEGAEENFYMKNDELEYYGQVEFQPKESLETQRESIFREFIRLLEELDSL